MNPQSSLNTKTSSAQQFLASQFSKQPDKARLQQLIPVQLHFNCFEKKNIEPFEHRQSPPSQQQSHCTKPSQKPQQHKPNMSLQNKSNINLEQLQEKLQTLKQQKRDYSPNSDAIRQLLKNTKLENEAANILSRRPQSIVHDQITLTPTTSKYPQKSHSPFEIKESVAQLLSNHFKTDASSPKGNSNIKQKNTHFSPSYLSIQSQIKQQKQKGHSSANSISYGAKNHQYSQQQETKRTESGIITPTPKKFTTTSQNTEHSKSKSVVEEQLQCMKIMQFDKENHSNFLNLGTPSAFINSEQASSIGDSVGMHLQFGVKTSPPFQKTQPQRFCVYHKDKKAKYVAEQSNDYLFFCSKCAVKLAGKGMTFTEIAQLKSSTTESQGLSFQQSSIESYCRQSSAMDMQFKEKEMKSFLNLLQQIQQNRSELLSQLSTQGTKLTHFYDSQIKQCKDVKQHLAIFLEEIYLRSVNRLQHQKQDTLELISSLYQRLQENQSDTQNIQSDIESNWKGVLEKIDMAPFKEIMTQYQVKFSKMGELQQDIYNQCIQLSSMGPIDFQATMSLIAQNFEIIEQPIPLVQSFQSQTQGQPIRTQPTPPKKREESTSQRIKTDFSIKKTTDINPQNFCQYFLEKQDQGKEEPQKTIPSSSIHNTNSNNLYISFENKEIFMNALEAEKIKQISSSEDDNTSKQQAIMILQSYRGSHADIAEESLNMSHDSQKSAPHSPASGQTKESVQRTSVKPEQEFQLVSNNQNEAVPKEAFQKQKNTFRTLFQNDDQQDHSVKQQFGSPKKETVAVSPARSEKFKSILNRISNSQSKTQQYYQQILQGHQKTTSETPDVKKSEIIDTETCKKTFQDFQESQEIKDSVQQINLCDDQQDLSDYENDECPQVIGQEFKQTENGEQYKKTLFSSPMFKDH